jgi:membrane-associated phospholipid phosphatase
VIDRLRARHLWPLWFAIGVIAAALFFKYLDMPLAHRFSANIGRAEALSQGLGSAVLLTVEAATVLTLVVARLVRGHITAFSKAVVLASLTSMCAYAVNESVLKVFFGVPNPSDVLLEGARHSFHLMSGTLNSSFPSGHMILASAFAGVFIKLYPRGVLPLSALLAFGAALLVWGDWHFASDTIAGTLAGISAGWLAAELWLVHSENPGHDSSHRT